MNDLLHKGALRDQNSFNKSIERWYLTSDVDQLFMAKDDDVIWVSSIEALQDKLEHRHPGHSGLSRCIAPDDDSVLVYRYPVVRTEYNDPHAAEDVLRAARAAGTVCIHQWCPVPREVWDECVLVEGRGATTVLRYDPKRAKKIKERDRRRCLSSPLPTFQFFNVLCRLDEAMEWMVSAPSFSRKGNRTRLDYISAIKEMLWLYERAFGRGSFRQLKGWQEFVVAWKARQAPTEKALMKDEGTCAPGFVAFMAKEARRRKVPTTLLAPHAFYLQQRHRIKLPK